MTENASSVSANPAVREQRRNRCWPRWQVWCCLPVAAGAYWWLHASHFVSTDNAYAAAEVAQVTPSIGGTVLEVLVRDTQAVKQGDVLVRIDPTDARLALAQAEAELARATRRVKGYVANDGGLKAQVTAREADESARRPAAGSRGRYGARHHRPAAPPGPGQERFGLGRGTDAGAERFCRSQGAAGIGRGRAGTGQGQPRSRHWCQAGQRHLDRGRMPRPIPRCSWRRRRDQAQVDLDRSTVRAPVDGVVAKRSVQIGQRVQAGAPLMTVVPVQRIYVDANFKEGQLGKVRVGQRVQLQSDLYGSDVKYSGTVVGFSGGSGSAFAAIPAQNATGNWIKVVQRLPVRIQLDAAELAKPAARGPVHAGDGGHPQRPCRRSRRGDHGRAVSAS
jgi:membrane fusion protein (multidrug efflux system)